MSDLIHPFPEAVRAGLDRIGAAGPLLVACSGGGDSLALLRACVELGEPATAACFDHRQRPRSRADGSTVASFAQEWGCEYVSGEYPGAPGASEDALRTARYGWLARAAAAAGAGWVLTGHTADDRAETVLLRIVRGTGPAGLAGIPASGPVPGAAAGPGTGPVRVGRPLLGVTGAAARAFLTDRGVVWREDPSNAAPNFARNRLRLAVLPRLAELNPRWRDAVLRLSDLAADEAAAAGELAATVAAAALTERSPTCLAFDAGRLPPVGSPARTLVLRRAWRFAGWPERRVTAATWRRLAALAPGGSLDLPHGVRAEHGVGLRLTRRVQA